MARRNRKLHPCWAAIMRDSGNKSKKTAPRRTPAPKPIKKCMPCLATIAMEPSASVENIASDVNSKVVITIQSSCDVECILKQYVTKRESPFLFIKRNSVVDVGRHHCE